MRNSAWHRYCLARSFLRPRFPHMMCSEALTVENRIPESDSLVRPRTIV